MISLSADTAVDIVSYLRSYAIPTGVDVKSPIANCLDRGSPAFRLTTHTVVRFCHRRWSAFSLRLSPCIVCFKYELSQLLGFASYCPTGHCWALLKLRLMPLGVALCGSHCRLTYRLNACVVRHMAPRRLPLVKRRRKCHGS